MIGERFIAAIGCDVLWVDLLWPHARDDAGDAVGLGLVQHKARVNRSRVCHHAQPQAGWPAAIGHGLAHIDRDDLAYGAIAGHHLLGIGPNACVLAAFLRHDQRHCAAFRSAIGQSHKLSVEQIACDGIGKADRAGWHFDHFQCGESGADGSISALLVGKGLCMGEKHAFIGDSDDIIVERSCGDGGRVLLDKDAMLGVEPMKASDSAAGLDMLASGICAARLAIDKDFDALCSMPFAQAHVIGRSLIAESGRDCAVQGEVIGVGKGKRELGQSVRPFLRTVQHGDKIGWGDVATPIGGVGRWADCGGIGSPHGGSRPRSGANWRRFCAIERKHLTKREIGAGQGHEKALNAKPL